MQQQKIRNGTEWLIRRCKYYAIAVVLAATACAPTKPPLPTQTFQATSSEEMLNARMAYDDCLIAAARKADDGKSDASTIALAMKSQCIPQTERVVRALAGATIGPGISAGEAYLSAKTIVEEQYRENAIKAVLFVRKGKQL
jgi:hypothetical protein